MSFVRLRREGGGDYKESLELTIIILPVTTPGMLHSSECSNIHTVDPSVALCHVQGRYANSADEGTELWSQRGEVSLECRLPETADE